MSQRLCIPSSEVPERHVKQVTPPGRDAIAVYNIGGRFYATDDTCTHGQASLSDGEIEDELIICPHHGGAFCIRTGEARGAPCTEPVRTYAVERQGDQVVILLES